MDKNYIRENGILELYILGELNHEEQVQVEAILDTDNELRQECIAIENTIESLALENAITPNSKIKSQLLSSIKESQETPKIENTKTSFFKYAAASAAILFLVSSAFLYSKWQTAENNLQVLQKEHKTLNNNVITLKTNLETTKNWYNQINSPEVSKFILKGNAKSPNSKAVAYVNHREKKVILNTEGLVKISSNKTYQMWADVKGEMINMGVIPKDQKMIAMTYINNAESLNITIEPIGGSKHPTVERLITNVYL